MSASDPKRTYKAAQEQWVKSLENVELNAHAAWDKGLGKQALKLFQKGAGAGLVGCMLNLGYFYDVGIGTSSDKTTAMHWYKRAYRRGDAAAASNIAVLYQEQGRNRLAFGWYARSAALGDGDSSLELAKMSLAGLGVRRSVQRARRYLKAALSSACITQEGLEQAGALMRELVHRGRSYRSINAKVIRSSS
ncbi:hypothetical protein [Lysobacter panacisoli]